MNRLEEAYRQLGEDAPAVGDADRAIGTVRHRRRAVAAGVPALAAALVVAALFFGTLGRSGPEPVASAPAFSIGTWARPMSPTNNGAQVGTMLSKECDGGCDFYLRRADGKRVRLSQLRPDLAELLSKHGFDRASLSYDAKWLGVTVGRGYELHRLTDPSQVITLPAGPAGSEWRVIDWGRGSENVALGLYVDGWVRRYAWVSLVGDEKVDTYVPETEEIQYGLPGRIEGNGVLLELPALTVKGSPETVLTTDVLNLTGPDKGKLTTLWSGTTRPDVRGIMRPDETLVGGPDGQEVSSCPPVEGTEICSTLLWTRSEPQQVTGVFKAWTGSDGTRFNVPDGDAWIYTGLLPIDAIAVRHNRTIRPDELVAVYADGRRQVITTLENDSMVLLPGMRAPA